MNLILGDSKDKLKDIPDNSIDAIITDPPYGISFMSKKWDYDLPDIEIWKECLRVAKPGAHLLSFGGTRTFHRLTCSIEDAGWEIRDCISWVYGSGFPKSLNIGKAIDKEKGLNREVVGSKVGIRGYSLKDGIPGGNAMQGNLDGSLRNAQKECEITIPNSDDAKKWDGWGTALKPAWEPIILARKSIEESTIASNVLKYGTGGINIDGCRVDLTNEFLGRNNAEGDNGWKNSSGGKSTTYLNMEKGLPPQGRWPANFIHDGSDEVLELFQNSEGGAFPKKNEVLELFQNSEGGAFPKKNEGSKFFKGIGTTKDIRLNLNDSGSAARFFYCAKASKSDRNEGLENNNHPTVKPTALMQYLCRLVTPKGGIVLDPFMGSGSTGKAAILEKFDFIGIEREEEFMKIAKARIEHAMKESELDLFQN